MAENRVAFRWGLLDALKSAEHAEGTFSVTTDEKALYLDVADGQRIRIGDFIKADSLEALSEIEEPADTALYYAVKENCLAFHDTDKGWVQINPDTGATGAEVTGTGKDGFSASYDKSSRKITITVSKTFLTGEEVDGKITAVVGTVPESKTVVEYIDEKTKDIANESEITDLTGRLETLEGSKEKWDTAATDATAIKADYLKKADKTELQNNIDAKQDTLEFQTAYNAGSNKAATMADITSALSKLSGAMRWMGTVDTEPDTESGAGHEKGDVVSYKGVEYAWDGTAWQKLGDESMYSDKVDGWNTAAAQTHTHSNKDELDKVKANDTSKWNTAATTATANSTAISGIKNGTAINDFKAVETALEGKADDADVQNLVGTEASIKASTIKEAAKEAETYADTKITEALTWGSF